MVDFGRPIGVPSSAPRTRCVAANVLARIHMGCQPDLSTSHVQTVTALGGAVSVAAVIVSGRIRVMGV